MNWTDFLPIWQEKCGYASNGDDHDHSANFSLIRVDMVQIKAQKKSEQFIVKNLQRVKRLEGIFLAF